jgi:UDP-3-O-[3-hydroxymyristoyl] glucosamine N-acyltransferase
MTRTAGELAAHLRAKLAGDANLIISGVASPESARAEDLIYVESGKHVERAAASAARCVLAKSSAGLAGKAVIEVGEPKFAFAKAAAWIAPPAHSVKGIHGTAIVAPSARLGSEVSVGPYAVIEDDVVIDDGSTIDAFCFLGRASRVGKNCWLHPRVTLYAGSQLADRVEIHSGAVIGGDGFGFVFGEGRHWKFPQIGRVEIGEDVEIGSNTTIDRGSLAATQIAADAKIDNLVQIAHNVRIGEHTVIASQTGISGSSVVGKNVMIGGQAGMGEHCTIEDGAIIGGQAGILPGKIVRSGQIMWGTPVRTLEKFKEQFAWSARLPELAARVRKLEEQSGGK